jgi:plasmid maintenance system antidote protein VapI
MEGVRMSAKQALVHAIESEMARQGISRRNLARRLGCTQENVAQILDDQRPGTRLDTAERLASALGRCLFLALIPETSLEMTFTFPLDVAERVNSEARRQNIPTDEFVLQLIVKALEI